LVPPADRALARLARALRGAAAVSAGEERRECMIAPEGSRSPGSKPVAVSERMARSNKAPGVPVPTFVSVCSTVAYERWNQKDTSKYLF